MAGQIIKKKFSFNRLKPYKLWLGDCLDLMKQIEAGSIDLICCDLPYGTTKCSWDIVIDFTLLWEQYKRIIKPNGAICLFGSEPFSSYLRLSNIKEYRYDWIWHKNRPTGGRTALKQPMKCVETISIFYSKQPNYNPERTDRTEKELQRLSKNSLTLCRSDTFGDSGGYVQKRESLTKKYPTSYLNIPTVFSRSSEKVAHPTQKPVALMEYLIKTYSNPGELVLDNCMGSGTTGVAAVSLGRRFIGIEKEEKYFQIAKERIEAVVA